MEAKICPAVQQYVFVIDAAYEVSGTLRLNEDRTDRDVFERLQTRLQVTKSRVLFFTVPVHKNVLPYKKNSGL